MYAALAPRYTLKMIREQVNDADYKPIRSPGDVADLLMTMLADEPQENFVVVLLDTKNRVIGTHLLYVGNVNTAVVRVAEVLRPAIMLNAVNFIIAHNHPSGDPTPSPEDVRMTEIVNDAAKLMDICLIDHIVIGETRYVSLKERGLGFS